MALISYHVDIVSAPDHEDVELGERLMEPTVCLVHNRYPKRECLTDGYHDLAEELRAEDIGNGRSVVGRRVIQYEENRIGRGVL